MSDIFKTTMAKDSRWKISKSYRGKIVKYKIYNFNLPRDLAD